MEPSTPPRSSRSRDFPATPATPRYGSYGDLPDEPRKLKQDHTSTGAASAATGTPHRAKRSSNLLATPRQTPRKRRDKEKTVRHKPPQQLEAKVNNSLLHKLREPDTVPDIQQKATKPHPHQDAPPPDVPGMWYVFRGKKIFRPLPPGEKPMEPVTLFKDVLGDRKPAKGKATDDIFKESIEENDNDSMEADSKDSMVEENLMDRMMEDSGSEADTDVEWSP